MSALKLTPPSETLFAILITFLTPLFLGAPTGNYDLAVARAAAIETVSSFRIRTPWDLLKVTQIVSFGIAALGSLGLSMADNLTLNMILRCRSNANALQRSSDRAEDRLLKAQALDPADASDLEPPNEDALLEAFRQAAEAQQAVAEAKARAHQPAVEPEPEPEDSPGMIALRDALEDSAAAKPELAAAVVATRARRATAKAHPAAQTAAQRAAAQDHSIMFAEAMATVATEFAQEMAHLPLAEQRKHQMRITALKEVSQKLSRGEPLDTGFMPGFHLPAGGHRGAGRTTT